jgi:emp24/gp25L/p24 family/GOLD
LRGCRNVEAWIDDVSARHGDVKSVWTSTAGRSEETYSIQVDGDQRYRLCFESSSRRDRREGRHNNADDEDENGAPYDLQLGFNVRVQPAAPRALPDQELGPDVERAMTLLESAIKTEEQWQNLLDHFDFLRNREAMHRQLTSQINDRVMGWTIVESILVVTMAVGQVWYWKAFFEKRRYL